ncbi:hypothetical protein J5N97_004943 [Dioscorea zingiberensis]|uniref:Cytochrome P450 n=1 Tax=Dioscorea zingiberensis TaxID=325984 RepID=A0A9D5D8X8_9LILI|nr:hypothetical protein J5N97_004943 [Dioscorea zingiberensis]
MDLGWLDLDGHGRTMKEAVGVINKYHDPIIEERIEKGRRSGGDHIHGWPKEEMEDLLDVMIGLKDENGEPLLSLDEIKVQVADLFLAAVDNPSNVVEWAIAELINQPEILGGEGRAGRCCRKREVGFESRTCPSSTSLDRLQESLSRLHRWRPSTAPPFHQLAP